MAHVHDTNLSGHMPWCHI